MPTTATIHMNDGKIGNEGGMMFQQQHDMNNNIGAKPLGGAPILKKTTIATDTKKKWMRRI